MRPRIIGLVGPRRAGKSVSAEYLCKNYGYRNAANSDLLKNIAEEMGLPPDRENLGRIGDAIFSVLGNDLFAMFRIKNIGDEPIVVDGIRYPQEVECYRALEGFALISVDADFNVRFERARQSGESGKMKDVEISRFSSGELARSEKMVPALMDAADFRIFNTGGKAELFKAIDDIMESFE